MNPWWKNSTEKLKPALLQKKENMSLHSSVLHSPLNNFHAVPKQWCPNWCKSHILVIKSYKVHKHFKLWCGDCRSIYKYEPSDFLYQMFDFLFLSIYLFTILIYYLFTYLLYIHWINPFQISVIKYSNRPHCTNGLCNGNYWPKVRCGIIPKSLLE